jgi:hypothetical protein
MQCLSWQHAYIREQDLEKKIRTDPIHEPEVKIALLAPHCFCHALYTATRCSFQHLRLLVVRKSRCGD